MLLLSFTFLQAPSQAIYARLQPASLAIKIAFRALCASAFHTQKF